MSLTKAEQVIALYRGAMPIDEIVTAVDVDRNYALRCLTLAGMRTKAHNALRYLPEADLPPRVYRDPCSYCNVRADVGCRHNRWAA